MLGMGLMLFCLRAMAPGVVWKEKVLKFAFWSINIGLFTMVTVSLLPLGLVQTWASVEYGYWYARSPELMQTPVMEVLRWMRVPGDTLFAIGAIALAWFVAQQTMGPARRVKPVEVGAPEPVVIPPGSKVVG